MRTGRPPKLILPTKSELYNLHHIENKSIGDIARSLGISHERVRKEFIKHDIQRNNRRIETPSKETLEYLHYTQKLSLSKISIHFNVPPIYVTKWFTEYNLKRLTLRSPRKPIPQKEEILKLYTDKSASKRKLALHFNVDTETIRKWFLYHKIETKQWLKKPVISKDELISLHHNQKISVDGISQIKSCDWRTVKKALDYHEIEQKFHSTSDAEIELAQYISQYVSVEKTRTALGSRKELDIFIREKNIGIEYCGLFWHSEKFLPNNYHVQKYKECNQSNITLFTIFEDEWIQHKDIVKSVILSKLGIFEERIFSRKCSVRHVDSKIAREFFDNTHMQGRPASIKMAVGLFYNDVLVGCMSFGNHHRDTTILVLNRMSFKANTQIIGGASRMFAHFVRNFDYDEVISWSDNRWSTGNVYRELGFQLDDTLDHDYSYVNNKQERKSKQSMKKSATGCPQHITEKQWCNDNGWWRIYDCGKRRWAWTRNTA